MIETPPYLKQGDTIALVCPAGFMPAEKVAACIHTLQEWGFNTKAGSTIGGDSPNYFSGSDEQRLHDLQQAIDDDSVSAIMCARGGYGLTRIIDRLRFKRFRKNPKWIIGFSDITVLHSHIVGNFGIATLHAPMAAAFNDGGADSEFVQSLRHTLQGKQISYEVPAHEFDRKGSATGELIGGNLALLAHLVGTSSDFSPKGKILFIEDIGEYLYNVDRMLYQLKRAGKFHKLKGLIVGGFTDMKDTERPFGKTVYEIIREILKDEDFPVCFNFPVSHSRENYALKLGAKYSLTVGDNVLLEQKPEK